MVIARSEPLNPLLNIPGFSRGILRAVTVKNITGTEILAESQKTSLFGYPDGGVGSIAQYKPIEP
jgi:hypothetical protein